MEHPIRPRGYELARCEPALSEPIIAVSKEGFTKYIPPSYGGKRMPPRLKKHSSPGKKPFIWYEKEEPYLDAYIKKLNREKEECILYYNRPQTAKENVVRKMKLPVEEILRKAYRKDRISRIISKLDVKNEQIFQYNRANAQRAKMKSMNDNAGSVKSSSTAKIIDYFDKNP